MKAILLTSAVLSVVLLVGAGCTTTKRTVVQQPAPAAPAPAPAPTPRPSPLEVVTPPVTLPPEEPAPSKPEVVTPPVTLPPEEMAPPADTNKPAAPPAPVE